MTKKVIQLCFIIITLVLVAFVVMRQKDGTPANTKKDVRLGTAYGIFSFQMPRDWNAYLNGDPQYLNSLLDYPDRDSFFGSVSVTDRPITFSDINGFQLDFALTEKNLITDEFINEQRQLPGQSFRTIDLPNFGGFATTDTVESDQATKGDTGGTIYYLTPKSDPTWNLIISQQMQGSEEFQQGVDRILESLEFVKE